MHLHIFPIEVRSIRSNHMSNAIISLPEFIRCHDQKEIKIPRLRNMADVTEYHCIILGPR